MGYLGLVPSKHSSVERTSRGRITKTGNAHARRLLSRSRLEPSLQGAHRHAGADSTTGVVRTDTKGGPDGAAAADSAVCRIECTRLASQQGLRRGRKRTGRLPWAIGMQAQREKAEAT